TPSAAVTAASESLPDAKVPLAPLPGTVNSTVTPPTGLPNSSSTLAFNGKKALVTGADCLSPANTARLAGAPAVFVKLNSAGSRRPVLALTRDGPPARVLGWKADEVAMPTSLVLTTSVSPPPTKVPLGSLGPPLGAVNVTSTPRTGLPLASVTRAWSGANSMSTVARCGLVLPVMLAGSPVRLKA